MATQEKQTQREKANLKSDKRVECSSGPVRSQGSVDETKEGDDDSRQLRG